MSKNTAVIAGAVLAVTLAVGTAVYAQTQEEKQQQTKEQTQNESEEQTQQRSRERIKDCEDDACFEERLQNKVQSGKITEEQAEMKRLHRENPEEFKKQKLEQAVQDGTITQEEANEIQAWCDAKPEALGKFKKEYSNKQGFGKFGKGSTTETENN